MELITLETAFSKVHQLIVDLIRNHFTRYSVAVLPDESPKPKLNLFLLIGKSALHVKVVQFHRIDTNIYI